MDEPLEGTKGTKKSHPPGGWLEVVPEAGIEPARLAARDFLPASAFAAGGFSRRKKPPFVGWSTPSPWPCGFRRPPSALYTFLRWQAWLGVGRARGRGRSPNLTGFTPGVSARRLKLFQVPCVYRFHHSGFFSGNPPRRRLKGRFPLLHS